MPTKFTVKTFPLGPLETNSYLIHHDTEAAVFDVGGNPAPMVEYLQTNGLRLAGIFCTHLHFDHTYGIAALVKATGAPVYASEKDAYMLENEFGKGGAWALPEVEPYSFTPIDEGEITIMGTTCQVIATPGHTPGGLSFYLPEATSLFAGDTLFFRSVGRSDFPGGSEATLLESIRTKLFVLPRETVVYPGHGPKTSIGSEKLNNPFVSDFV